VLKRFYNNCCQLYTFLHRPGYTTAARRRAAPQLLSAPHPGGCRTGRSPGRRRQPCPSRTSAASRPCCPPLPRRPSPPRARWQLRWGGLRGEGPKAPSRAGSEAAPSSLPSPGREAAARSPRCSGERGGRRRLRARQRLPSISPRRCGPEGDARPRRGPSRSRAEPSRPAPRRARSLRPSHPQLPGRRLRAAY